MPSPTPYNGMPIADQTNRMAITDGFSGFLTDLCLINGAF